MRESTYLIIYIAPVHGTYIWTKICLYSQSVYISLSLFDKLIRIIEFPWISLCKITVRLWILPCICSCNILFKHFCKRRYKYLISGKCILCHHQEIICSRKFHATVSGISVIKFFFADMFNDNIVVFVRRIFTCLTNKLVPILFLRIHDDNVFRSYRLLLKIVY